MAKKKSKVTRTRKKSPLEEQANMILLADGLADGMQRAWPELKVALEIEGGIWAKGRHVSPRGFILDCEKYNEASSLGWVVLRCPPTFIGSKMVTWLKSVLQRRSCTRVSDERTT